MSEASYFWPSVPGKYTIEATDGDRDDWSLGNDGMWACDEIRSRTFSTEEMASDGYLGVRREPAKLQQGPQPIVPVTDTSITANLSVVPPTPKIITPDPDDGNAMAAQEALNELRMCRKSYQFERWSIKWGKPLTEMLGAR